MIALLIYALGWCLAALVVALLVGAAIGRADLHDEHDDDWSVRR